MHNYADLAAPLSYLLKKECTLQWTKWEQTAFEGLKTALTTAPVLVYLDFTHLFLYTTDASDIAVGAVLIVRSWEWSLTFVVLQQEAEFC